VQGVGHGGSVIARVVPLNAMQMATATLNAER
jgi:hypothetical protein